MTNHPEAGEKIFKKGEVIYQQGDYVSAIYDVLYGMWTITSPPSVC